MREYWVRYKNDKGKTRTYDKYHNKAMAKEQAGWLVEDKVWIEVFEVKKIESINVYPNKEV